MPETPPIETRISSLVGRWRKEAHYLRGQSAKNLKAAGISKDMRDYAVARYEDSADELASALNDRI
jgi:hypothetical protein